MATVGLSSTHSTHNKTRVVTMRRCKSNFLIILQVGSNVILQGSLHKANIKIIPFNTKLTCKLPNEFYWNGLCTFHYEQKLALLNVFRVMCTLLLNNVMTYLSKINVISNTTSNMMGTSNHHIFKFGWLYSDAKCSHTLSYTIIYYLPFPL